MTIARKLFPDIVNFARIPYPKKKKSSKNHYPLHNRVQGSQRSVCSFYNMCFQLESSIDVLPVPVITTLINTQKLRKTCNLLYVFPHFVDFNMPYYHSVFSVIFC